MCDQLAGVGVECNPSRMDDLFYDSLRYAAAHPFPYVPNLHRSPPLPWASPSLDQPWPPKSRDAADCPGKYDKHHQHPDGPPPLLWRTARPWALGQTRYPTSRLQLAAGSTVRKPGLYCRIDPETNRTLPDEPLLHTAERIHASVRVRLACGGLSMDDRHEWTCEGLTGRKGAGDHDNVDSHGNVDVNVHHDSGHHRSRTPTWRVQRVHDSSGRFPFARHADSDSDSADNLYRLSNIAASGQWLWVYNRTAKGQPPIVLPEELPTGHWERLLLGMTTGYQDVFAWAAAHPPQNF